MATEFVESSSMASSELSAARRSPPLEARISLCELLQVPGASVAWPRCLGMHRMRVACMSAGILVRHAHRFAVLGKRKHQKNKKKNKKTKKKHNK